MTHAGREVMQAIGTTPRVRPREETRAADPARTKPEAARRRRAPRARRVGWRAGSLLLAACLGLGVWVPPAAARPAERRAQKAPGRATDAPAKRAPVDINSAGESQLTQLPGIGPALARRIVDFRDKHGPFRRVEDLMKVRGIGEKSFEKLRPLVKVVKPG